MALSVAKIAKIAFDGVAGAISGVAKAASLAFDTQGGGADDTEDYGDISDGATEFEDFGSIADATTESEDYGSITATLSVYNAVTGQWTLTTTTITGGRAIIGTQAAIASKFPAYVAGPDDTLMFLEGFTSVPAIGWRVTAGGITRTIKAVGDIAEGGGFFEVVAV